MNGWTSWIPLAVAVLAGAAIVAWAASAARRLIRQARDSARRLLAQAREESERRIHEAALEAQEKALALTEELDRRERELEDREARLDQRAGELKAEARRIRERERALANESRRLEAEAKGLAARARKVETQEASLSSRLEEVAALTRDEARRRLLAEVEEEARKEGRRIARKVVDEARERAEREAMGLVIRAMQRVDLKKAAETTVTYIELPSDDLKGRIIGREGRNIRALEAATGIDLLVDDTPRSIVISCFDPVRREVARLAIQRLIEDGRIHPARIEEVVEKVRADLETTVEEAGAEAAFQLGIAELHPKLARGVGRLQFYTAHGQNLLQHSMEVAWIAGHLASELGGDADLLRRAGLLHEIGRTEPEVSGHPAEVSADLAARHGESERVVAAIRSLRRDAEEPGPEGLLLQTADRISALRPGARKDNLEVFIERLRRLEELAGQFPGVQRAFAVKAGKELRVLVDAGALSDRAAQKLSREIARAVERELSFQGRIKVSVIRETRAVQYAL